MGYVGGLASGYRECVCCGQVTMGARRCEGCREGECDPAETWHCSNAFGHRCDGTVCPTTYDELYEYLDEQVQRGELGCAWFARCERVATELVPHPVLGRVPACERCANIGR